MDNQNENMKSPKVSVAMATYNGAAYIEKQITSIIDQTLRVDEIIISDDGSSDSTLEIVQRISKSSIASGIDFVILTDNPRHGYCGNFEYAISHCTGDYIFLSDQDDIWMEDKVQKVIQCFKDNPSMKLIFHNGCLIDKNDNIVYINNAPVSFLQFDFHKGVLNPQDYLKISVLRALCIGMAMCISKELLDEAIPFPRVSGAHDQWLMFCALCENGSYFLDESLSYYRIHGKNTAGVNNYKGSIFDRLPKIMRRIKEYSNTDDYSDMVVFCTNTMAHLKEYGLQDTESYSEAEQAYEVGIKLQKAFNCGRFMGSCKLIRLFITDTRYRKSGTNSFIYQFLGLLFHSRK